MRVVEDATYDALGAADLSIVCSGTATVEAALLDAPMIVVYRLAPVTAAIARLLVRTPMFAMVNLIAGKQVVPELVQKDFTSERLADEAVRLLVARMRARRCGEELAEVREKLGPPGAVERAADIIAGMLRRIESKRATRRPGWQRDWQLRLPTWYPRVVSGDRRGTYRPGMASAG